MIIPEKIDKFQQEKLQDFIQGRGKERNNCPRV